MVNTMRWDFTVEQKRMRADLPSAISDIAAGAGIFEFGNTIFAESLEL